MESKVRLRMSTAWRSSSSIDSTLSLLSCDSCYITTKDSKLSIY
mgnify:CR=1 FL=1